MPTRTATHFRHDDAERFCTTVKTRLEKATTLQESEQTQVQGALSALLIGLLAIADSTTRLELEGIYHVLRRTLLVIASAETLLSPAYYAGQLSLLLELADLLRHQIIPHPAAEALAKSDLARLTARIILEHGSLSPTDLAHLAQKAQPNLVPIVRNLETVGLVRRETFGRRVRLLPTSLLRAAAAQGALDEAPTSLPQAAAKAALANVADAHMANLTITPHPHTTVVSIEKEEGTREYSVHKLLYRQLVDSLGHLKSASGELVTTDPTRQKIFVRCSPHRHSSSRAVAKGNVADSLLFASLKNEKNVLDAAFAIHVGAAFVECKGDTKLVAQKLGTQDSEIKNAVKTYELKATAYTATEP